MGGTKAIGQKPGVTDADEAFGQHVQKEAESHALWFEGQQAMIGNGHAMGVATQIAQHLRALVKRVVFVAEVLVFFGQKFRFLGGIAA